MVESSRAIDLIGMLSNSFKKKLACSEYNYVSGGIYGGIVDLGMLWNSLDKWETSCCLEIFVRSFFFKNIKLR